MRFAIVGTRGIPARYGGFETFAEELSTRLAARGHQRDRLLPGTSSGTVLPRRAAGLPAHHPAQIFRYHRAHLPFHAASWRLAGRKQDAVLYCNAANAVFTWMPRVLGMPVGSERRRPGAESQEMEPAGEGLVPDVGMAGHLDAERRGHRRASDRRIIIASATSAHRR